MGWPGLYFLLDSIEHSKSVCRVKKRSELTNKLRDIDKRISVMWDVGRDVRSSENLWGHAIIKVT